VEAPHAQLEGAVSVSGLLGYLNFSDGRPDPRWQRQLNDAFAYYARSSAPQPWTALLDGLQLHLDKLHQSGSAAFKDVAQARAVLTTTAAVLPAYRAHHGDLLAHLADHDLFGPFFLARVFEAVLALRAADPQFPLSAVLARLNDFVGHRPIAILETRPQGEPYDHERHRPLPLYLRGAGVAYGRYHDLIRQALDILNGTDPALLQGTLNLELLDELALDLRAYDHGHPVNRRPNYVFGEWDPHHIDNQGRYRRYVCRKITLDALLERVEQGTVGTPQERLFEAGAVLAGTILMAAGISGSGPTAHDSSTTLASLLPRIAQARDEFYNRLLERLTGAHAARLKQEQAITRQAFGGARQHLNAYLGRHRATQLQQRYLVLLFAEMGYPEESREEAGRIQTASVRLLSEVLGRLTSGQVEIDRGDLGQAAGRLPEVEELLHRGIACGAFADPWNILGFQGLFPLSPAREDAIRDPRLDELVQMVEQTFHLYARLMSESAAAGDGELVRRTKTGLDRLAAWWDQFATVEVSDVRRVHGAEASASAHSVAVALAGWHERGESSADLAFWKGRLDSFRSPKAFALVVDTLLRKGDFRAALGLLVAWLGQAEQVPLEDGPHSFHNLAMRWALSLTAGEASDGPRRELLRRFLAALEANAEDYWLVPAPELLPMPTEAEEGLYDAAYEDVTYQDSADQEDGDVAAGGPEVEADVELDLERESERLEKRLRFLSTVARLWQVGGRFLAGADEGATLHDWLRTASDNQQRLLALLDAIHAHDLPEPSGDYESIVEYDRRRVVKEQLLHTIIGTCLDTAMAVGALRGVCSRGGKEAGSTEALATSPADAPSWEPFVIRLEQALFEGDAEAARLELAPFMERFQEEPLLFAPLTEGGAPRAILRVRIAQTVLRALLANLPRLGLLRETYDLLRTARAMEQARTEAPGRRAITEFNHFFQSAYQAVVECVVSSAPGWSAEHAEDAELVGTMERLTGPFLALWIEHSRTLQLSVLEGVASDAEWRALKSFVQRYGNDLFHARFMTLGNLRGILHRGAGNYLDYLRDNPDPLRPVRLLDDLGVTYRREDAVRRLELVLQAVIENYEEYKDYNTTTTQSDYGENLHILLDFFRLKVAYDRHAWQFRPLVMAHEVLARHGRTSTAVRWERSLTQFTRDLGNQHLEQLARLERTHGVRLGTIADRLNERFIKPLALDRLCALIEPSMREARTDAGGAEGRRSFARLRTELDAYTATPTGVGLDVPAWLRRLEAEVHRTQVAQRTVATLAESFFRVPRLALSYEELQRQLREWDRPTLPR
jgi:hypothetical protein